MQPSDSSVDHAWVNHVIQAVDQAFHEDAHHFAAGLRLALMDAHRSPGCPRALQWMDEGVVSALRLDLLGPRVRDYDLLLLTWPAGHRTAIHDHQGASGFELILEGSLVVESFTTSTSPCLDVLPLNVTTLVQGEAGHFGGAHHAHRCTNPSLADAALSLHIYSRHLDQCRRYAHDPAGHWVSSTCQLASQPIAALPAQPMD